MHSDNSRHLATSRDHSWPLRHSFPNGGGMMKTVGPCFTRKKRRDVQRGAGCVPRCTKPSVVQRVSNWVEQNDIYIIDSLAFDIFCLKTLKTILSPFASGLSFLGFPCLWTQSVNAHSHFTCSYAWITSVAIFMFAICCYMLLPCISAAKLEAAIHKWGASGCLPWRWPLVTPAVCCHFQCRNHRKQRL